MKNKKEILIDLKEKISILNLLEEEKMKDKFKIGNIIKPMVAACIMLASISGIVFAKDISKRIYNEYFTGKGIENAINEGYIENTDMKEQSSNSSIKNEETGEIVEDTETTVKVSELIMDDFTLSMTFKVTLSNQAKNIISTKDIIEMNFQDIVVYDENNIILNTIDEEDIKKLSEKTNIVPKDIINSGVNTFVLDKNENEVKVVYNFYTGGGSSYPKSKELHIDMGKMKISKNETVMGNEEIVLKGNWNFKVDVPKKMYTRENIIYNQKSSTDKDFKVETAVVYNTGMEIKMRFQAEKQKSLKDIESEFSEELKFYWSLDKDDELRNIDILNYLESKVHENPEYQKLVEKEMDKWDFEKYLTNSNGEKFEFTQGPRENGSASIDENGIMTSTCMFDLTKFNATDEITLHLEYKGKKAEIVLEKVKN